jgi:hypothetical protein
MKESQNVPVSLTLITEFVVVHLQEKSVILYIKALSACVRLSVRDTRQFRVLIRRRNRPGQSDGRTDRQIFYGRTGPDRRPLYNFDQRSLVSLSVSGQSVCDGGYQGWYLELSGTRRFFEVLSPTQTGGSFLFC